MKVESKSLSDMAYDVQNKKLSVKFHAYPKRTYTYEGVPADVAEECLKEHHGSNLNKLVRGKFTVSFVEE